MLKCEMCHKPLKAKCFQIIPYMRPDLVMTVGPDCYAKMKKAEKELRGRKTPEEIAALRVKLAACSGADLCQGHTASHSDAMICGDCGVHISELQ